IGFGLLFTSLKYISASSVSLICTLEIVFALLLTPFLLHQVPTAYELAGCMIVLISVACSMLGNGRQDRQRTANKGA
ncbi:MAG: DMT family transporter, partial [Synergistaceae bacterium]|nr:DMT family transporter [Synergistaceae bacterium]